MAVKNLRRDKEDRKQQEQLPKVSYAQRRRLRRVKCPYRPEAKVPKVANQKKQRTGNRKMRFQI
jgi:hypothetical protein